MMLEQLGDQGSEDQTRAQTPWRRFTPHFEILLSDGPAAFGSRRRICGIVSGFCHLDGNRGVDRKMGWWLNGRGESSDFPRVRTAVRLKSRQISGWPMLLFRTRTRFLGGRLRASEGVNMKFSNAIWFDPNNGAALEITQIDVKIQKRGSVLLYCVALPTMRALS